MQVQRIKEPPPGSYGQPSDAISPPNTIQEQKTVPTPNRPRIVTLEFGIPSGMNLSSPYLAHNNEHYMFPAVEQAVV